MQELKLDNSEHWRRLLRFDGAPCASFYVSLEDVEALRTANLRFKNLRRQAAQKLLEFGLGVRDVDLLLEPVQELARPGPQSWDRFGHGNVPGAVAVFARRGDARYLRLPLRIDDRAVVGRRFQILPLLPALRDASSEFHILALEMPNLRLLRANRYEIQEVIVPGLPGSLEDVSEPEDDERHLQFHTGTPSATGTGQRPAQFHGHPSAADDEVQKGMALRYFQQVDNVLTPWLHHAGREPLVLAGIEPALSLYRQANHYPHLLEAEVAVDPRAMNEGQILEAAWPLAAPEFDQEKAMARERLQQRLGTGEASAEVRDVAAAAPVQRVDTLFVARGEQRWSPDLEESGPGTIRDEREPGDEEVLNWTAIRALNGGADVYLEDRDKMPGGAVMAAIYRYAA